MLESTPEDFRPFIVVAPLSTLGNWEKEFELWVPEVNIVNFLGWTQDWPDCGKLALVQEWCVLSIAATVPLVDSHQLC